MNTTDQYGSGWVIGSIIEMYNHKFRIRENLGSYGHVEHLDGESACSEFYWDYKGESAVLIQN